MVLRTNTAFVGSEGRSSLNCSSVTEGTSAVSSTKGSVLFTTALVSVVPATVPLFLGSSTVSVFTLD